MENTLKRIKETNNLDIVIFVKTNKDIHVTCFDKDTLYQTIAEINNYYKVTNPSHKEMIVDYKLNVIELNG